MLRLGFDIGGTNIAAGLVDEAYRIVRETSRPFPRGQNSDSVADVTADIAQELCRKHGVEPTAVLSAGIAIPGSIDAAGETVIDAYNLGFHGVPFRSMVSERLGLPVYLGNDANAATLAEHRAGSLRGCRTAALITLGTGVGGGVIMGGQLFNGGRNCGVEIGHIPLRAGGRPCTCGNLGCIESYCSATRLCQDGEKLGYADAKAVIDAAKNGDGAAKALFDVYVDDLGSAIISIVHLIDPERIAIGGGVCNAGEFLLAPLRENALQKCFFSTAPDIVRATLGNDAGIVGAASLNE